MMVRKGFSLVEIVIVYRNYRCACCGAIGGLKYLEQVKLSTTNTSLLLLIVLLSTMFNRWRISIRY